MRENYKPRAASCMRLLGRALSGEEFVIREIELLANSLASVLHDADDGAWVLVALMVVAPSREGILVTFDDRICGGLDLHPCESATALLVPDVANERVPELLDPTPPNLLAE
jgi:hypothetical protein